MNTIQKLMIAAATFFIVGTCSAADSVYRTDWGGGFTQDISFEQVVNDTWFGSYRSYKNGRIIGESKNSGRKFVGYWVQDTSGKRCSRKQNGSHYWGRLSFNATTNDGFKGAWGYCNNKPSKPWTGYLLSK
ncbi:MAG: hypothetical protein R8K20_08885 [Gallionellaceae bacterium]